jgi:hypothetical protein
MLIFIVTLSVICKQFQIYSHRLLSEVEFFKMVQKSGRIGHSRLRSCLGVVGGHF